MKAFAFAAFDQHGATQRGRLLAETSAAALAQLVDEGLFPTEVVEAPVRRGWRSRPARGEVASALRSLASLVAIGVAMHEALTSTACLFKGVLATSLVEVREMVAGGMSLGAALDTVGWVPPAAVGMIRAAEEASQLAQGVAEAAAMVERDAALVSQVQQALAYPAMLLGVGTLSIGLVVGVVIPHFATLLEDAGTTLPPVTQLLLTVSTMVARYWMVWLALGASAAVGLDRWLRTPEGRQTSDRWLLRVPALGPLLTELNTGRVATALGRMVSAGIPLLRALPSAAAVARNADLQARVGRAAALVAEGDRLAVALDHEHAFTAHAVRLIAMGESNGRLGEMITRAGEHASEALATRLRIMVNLIEPAMVLGFAVAIGFVAAAMLQAVYALRPAGLP